MDMKRNKEGLQLEKTETGFYVYSGETGAFIPNSTVKELEKRGENRGKVIARAFRAIVYRETKTGDNLSNYLMGLGKK